MSDTKLLKKIDAAAQAVNKSEKVLATAQAGHEKAKADHVAKCKALGFPLLELKKRHPKVKDFEAALALCKHVKRATAYEYMKLVGGRKTDDEIRQAEQERREAARIRKQKSRTALPKPEPEPGPVKAVSVTRPDVTETSGEIDIEKRKEQMAALAQKAELTDEEVSDEALAAFKRACQDFCPKMSEADLKKARVYFNQSEWQPRAKRKVA